MLHPIFITFGFNVNYDRCVVYQELKVIKVEILPYFTYT